MKKTLFVSILVMFFVSAEAQTIDSLSRKITHIENRLEYAGKGAKQIRDGVYAQLFGIVMGVASVIVLDQNTDAKAIESVTVMGYVGAGVGLYGLVSIALGANKMVWLKEKDAEFSAGLQPNGVGLMVKF